MQNIDNEIFSMNSNLHFDRILTVESSYKNLSRVFEQIFEFYVDYLKIFVFTLIIKVFKKKSPRKRLEKISFAFSFYFWKYE